MQVVMGTSAGKQIGITNRIRQDMRNLQKEVKECLCTLIVVPGLKGIEAQAAAVVRIKIQ